MLSTKPHLKQIQMICLSTQNCFKTNAYDLSLNTEPRAFNNACIQGFHGLHQQEDSEKARGKK